MYEHSRRKEALLHHEAVEASTTQNTKFTRITKCTFIRTTTLHSTTLTALVESSYFPGTCHITTQHYTSIVTFNVFMFSLETFKMLHIFPNSWRFIKQYINDLTTKKVIYIMKSFYNTAYSIQI